MNKHDENKYTVVISILSFKTSYLKTIAMMTHKLMITPNIDFYRFLHILYLV